MKHERSCSVISLVFLALMFLRLSAEPVKDAEGADLKPDGNYVIVPATSGNAGGICPAPRKIDLTDLCKVLDVVQSVYSWQGGQPVSFIPQKDESGSVPLSTDLNIRFELAPIWLPCFGTKIWRADRSDEFDKTLISTDGQLSQPDSMFRIEKAEDGQAYKLTHCSSSSSNCSDVGSFKSNDIFKTPRLFLIDPTDDTDAARPLLVKFQKVTSENRFVRPNLWMFPGY